MEKTLRIKALERFEQHMFAILPLYSVSGSDAKNQVISYCMTVLADLGRVPYIDKYWNIVAEALVESADRRAIVAHTDTVGATEHTATWQSIRYNRHTDIIYNRSMRRAMGGDDKVGVAIALVIAEFMPEINVWLVANEEIGCIGSSGLDTKPVDFALQFDRRGSTDLVNEIFCELATRKTTQVALTLLPHRRVVSGMTTDVGTLVERGLAKCAFNMSCGYYQPHSAQEYIVYSEAQQSMNDALTLLMQMETDDFEQANNKPSYRRFGYGYGVEDWGDGVEWTGGDSSWRGKPANPKDDQRNFIRPSASGYEVIIGEGNDSLDDEVAGLRESLRHLIDPYAHLTEEDLNRMAGHLNEDDEDAEDRLKAYRKVYDLDEEGYGTGENKLYTVSCDPNTICNLCDGACTSGACAKISGKIVCEECIALLRTREAIESMVAVSAI